jgi:hypothetical protein
MTRNLTILLTSLLTAQVRIEARLEEPPQKTSLQVEGQLTPHYLRWLYTGTWGGRDLPLMDILTRPEGSYLLDHQKKASYILKPDLPQVRAVSSPELLKKESYLGYAAEKYRLKLSDGSEMIFLWTKGVSFDWRPWKEHLRDPRLRAILEAGFTEGLPLLWQHFSAEGTLLSEWRVEQAVPFQPDPFDGMLPYDPIPIEKAVEVNLQQK